jgi:hypothetical protein
MLISYIFTHLHADIVVMFIIVMSCFDVVSKVSFVADVSLKGHEPYIWFIDTNVCYCNGRTLC